MNKLELQYTCGKKLKDCVLQACDEDSWKEHHSILHPGYSDWKASLSGHHSATYIGNHLYKSDDTL